MVTRVLSVLRNADPGAPRAADPVIDLNAYALAEDVELTLVLKAAGVELGLAGAHVRPATIGGLDVPAATAEYDLRALLASGVRVLAVEEDLAARGLGAADLVDGIETVPEAALAPLLTEQDVTLTWSLT
ncbi:MAG: DsrE family protein [Actinomycetota bacterium]|nr:DsrE family protein [Actinomycetota bacterium]